VKDPFRESGKCIFNDFQIETGGERNATGVSVERNCPEVALALVVITPIERMGKGTIKKGIWLKRMLVSSSPRISEELQSRQEERLTLGLLGIARDKREFGLWGGTGYGNQVTLKGCGVLRFMFGEKKSPEKQIVSRRGERGLNRAEGRWTTAGGRKARVRGIHRGRFTPVGKPQPRNGADRCAKTQS